MNTAQLRNLGYEAWNNAEFDQAAEYYRLAIEKYHKNNRSVLDRSDIENMESIIKSCLA